jgi:hypothetical protein
LLFPVNIRRGLAANTSRGRYPLTSSLGGRVFTEPLPRNRLHNPVVPLLVRVILRNGCFYGSTVLARGKYATIFKYVPCLENCIRFHVSQCSKSTRVWKRL